MSATMEKIRAAALKARKDIRSSNTANEIRDRSRDRLNNERSQRRDSNVSLGRNLEEATNIEDVVANQIRDKIKKTKEKGTVQDKLNQILDLLGDWATMPHKLTEMKENLELTAKAVAAHDELLEDITYHMSKKNILVKGLPLHEKAKNRGEKRHETIEVAKNLCKDLGLDFKLVGNVTRFNMPKEKMEAFKRMDKKIAPLLKIECISELGKGEFFGAISKNGAKMKGISFTNDYPQHLKQQYEQLDKAAFSIRKESNWSKKTKILARGSHKLILLVDGKEVELD